MVLCRNSLLGNVTKATVNIGVNRKWVNYPFKRRTLVGVNVMFCLMRDEKLCFYHSIL